MGGGGVLQVKMHEISKNLFFSQKPDFSPLYGKFLAFLVKIMQNKERGKGKIK
jgi:hypothetical protein